MGRRKKIDIERDKTRDYLEEQIQTAVNVLERYGNASLGLKIIDSYTPEAAASLLSSRTGRDIQVRVSVFPGAEIQGKKSPDDVYYIAEDFGPIHANDRGQIMLF